MNKAAAELRKFIRRSWDGSLTKISGKGQPDKYQNTDRAMLEMLSAALAEERERCAKARHPDDLKAMKEARFIIHDLLCADNRPRNCMTACRMLDAAIRRKR